MRRLKPSQSSAARCLKTTRYKTNNQANAGALYTSNAIFYIAIVVQLLRRWMQPTR